MPNSTEKCLFCRIISREIPANIILDDPDVLAFEDINPQAPTHILFVPRRHIASVDAMSEGDSETVGRVVARASEVARERHLSEDGYRLVFNHGDAAGQTVYHIHLHLLGGRSFGWPPG